MRGGFKEEDDEFVMSRAANHAYSQRMAVGSAAEGVHMGNAPCGIRTSFIQTRSLCFCLC